VTLNYEFIERSLPITAVILIVVFERLVIHRSLYADRRDFSILSIEVIGFVTSLLISYIFFQPIVNLSSRIDLVSISQLPLPKTYIYILSFVFVDCFIYCFHRLNHAVPWLWRLHRLHHSDQRMDALTAFLHHPIEIVSNSIAIIIFYTLFDIPISIAISYYIAMTIHGGFSHVRLLIPPSLEKVLKYFIILPNMHHIHHSTKVHEGNTNYGAIFPWWDMLFNTYIYKTKEALLNVRYGISKKESSRFDSVKSLLVNPFI